MFDEKRFINNEICQLNFFFKIYKYSWIEITIYIIIYVIFSILINNLKSKKGYIISDDYIFNFILY